MQIHSFSKVLALPIIFITVVIMYFSYNKPSETSIFILIPVILLVAIYVFHGPLDHWWLSKFPLKFDQKLREWLQKYFEPYNQLDDEFKKLFETRLTLYMAGRLFQSVGAELRNVPEDIKCMVSAHGVMVGLGHKDYLIGDMDRIFLYKHPFPTPDIPFLHSVEVNTEDGVIILSLEQLTNAVLFPSDYYNVGYHAYAEAFLAVHKDLLYPDVTDSWDLITKISNWDQQTILKQTGLESLNLRHIHITLYFSKPDQYKSNAPELFEKWKSIFRVHP
jgi:MtfA peptidase